VVRLTTKLGYLMIPVRFMISQAANEDSTISRDAHKNAVSRSVNGRSANNRFGLEAPETEEVRTQRVLEFRLLSLDAVAP
jgi:hypothetical protein